MSMETFGRRIRKSAATYSLLAWALLPKVCGWGDPVICDRCGWERDAAAARCPNENCSAVVAPVVQEPQPQPQPAPAAPAVEAKVVHALVQQELGRARDCLKANQNEMAWLYARNAAGLNALLAASAENPHAGSILAVQKATRVVVPVVVKCGGCDGSGKLKATRTLLSGDAMSQQVRCKECGGTGRVQRLPTVEERQASRGKALGRFAAEQSARRFVQMGEAWIPADLAGTLTVEQQAAVKRAVQPMCSACTGLGVEHCGTCDGSGRVSCEAAGCRDGLMRQEKELLSGKSVLRQKCAACGGTALTACGKCGGQGLQSCKICRGSGIPEICRRCDGSGLQACTRCGSKARDDDVCRHCGGGGHVLCSGCSGSGRPRQ